MPSLIALVARATTSLHAHRQTQISAYATYSRITLYAYDILLNLSREKELIWKEGLRPSSLLYYAVRYPVIAKQIFYLFYSRTHISHCDSWNQFTFTVSILITRIAIVISFILRVYAVMNGALFFVAVLTILGLLSTALDIVQVKELSCTQASNPFNHDSDVCYSRAFVLTFLSLIVFDVTATTLIVWKLVAVIKLQGGLKKLGSESVVALIIRSGTLYFIIITGIQLGAVILYFLRFSQGLFSTVLNDYTLIISSILISRFLLDLRSMSSGVHRSEDDRLPSLQFASRHDRTTSNGEQTDASEHWMSFVKDFEGTFYDDFSSESSEEDDGAEMRMEDLASRAIVVEERLQRNEML
ncbi:hypothetical protein BDQ12DRAFT_737650, partial [Crucibulum laeve]